MPGFDGTGPQGMGPGTGRGMGKCGGGMKRGSFGRGYSMGMGWQQQPISKEDEIKALKERLSMLEGEEGSEE